MKALGKALSLLVVAMLLSGIAGSSATEISVSPATITVHANEDLTFNIDVINVDYLIAYQVRLNWTSTLLNMINVTEGPFLGEDGSIGTSFGVLPSAGSFLAISNMQENWRPGTSGSGTLIECLFNSTDALGQTALKLCDTRLFNASYVLVDAPPNLGDCNGNSIGFPTPPDGDVDFYDFRLVTNDCINGMWYYAPADFNNDGVVDMYDLMCVYWNYGTTYEGGVKACEPVEITHQAQNGSVKITSVSVGGVRFAVDKFSLLAPYIGILSITLVAAVVTIIYHRRSRRRAV